MKFVVVGCIFLVGVAVLLGISIAQGKVTVYKVRDVAATASSGVECRVDNGRVVSIESAADPLRFTIRDDKDESALLKVVSDRHPPDNLKVNGGVGLRGVYDRSQGVFRAVELTTKCPSKYEADAGPSAYSEAAKPGGYEPSAGAESQPVSP